MEEQKKHARLSAGKRRAAIPEGDRRDQSFRLARGGLSFIDGLTRETVVSGYFPVGEELDCLPLMQMLTAAGMICCLPEVEADTGMLAFRVWKAGDKTIDGAYGIPVSPETAEQVTPGILLVPLLAFDSGGYRLGYGGGFYDRTLKALRSNGRVTAVGLAFEEQEVEAVPREDHDERLNWVLTAAGPRRCGD